MLFDNQKAGIKKNTHENSMSNRKLMVMCKYLNNYNKWEYIKFTVKRHRLELKKTKCILL